jgi:hypothetical protein
VPDSTSNCPIDPPGLTGTWDHRAPPSVLTLSVSAVVIQSQPAGLTAIWPPSCRGSDPGRGFVRLAVAVTVQVRPASVVRSSASSLLLAALSPKHSSHQSSSPDVVNHLGSPTAEHQ